MPYREEAPEAHLSILQDNLEKVAGKKEGFPQTARR